MTVSTRPTPPTTNAEFRAAIDSAVPSKANGTPLAALLASGIGVFILGVLTTGAVISVDLKNALALDKSIGPLAGKALYACVAYLLSFVVGYAVMRGKNYAPRPLYVATFVLVAGGFLLTFPIFFDLFSPKK